MAEAGGQDKTEKATPRRLREARKRGQVPRSRELSTAVVVGAGAALLVSAGPGIAHQAAGAMRAALDWPADGMATALADPGGLPALLGHGLLAGLLAVLPVLAATLLAALCAPLLIGGWNFAGQAIKPDLSRLNPVSGVGRLFSMQSLVELGKSLLKVGLIGCVAYALAKSSLGALLGLGHEDSAGGIGHGAALVLRMFLWLAASLALIAAVDVPYQLWHYGKQLKMSRQEIRDEHKQNEGRPEVKGRIRRLQQELSRRRMMDQVPKADVIVTNPTHYAVALQYSAGAMRAPRVVAKGADEVARSIRELADRHRIPRVEAPPLARALYRGCELEQEIPAALYAAVAQVLTYVYQLKTASGYVAPPEVGDVPGGEVER